MPALPSCEQRSPQPSKHDQKLPPQADKLPFLRLHLLRAQGVRKFSKNFEDPLYICLQMCYNKITENNTTHNIIEVQNYEKRYWDRR